MLASAVHEEGESWCWDASLNHFSTFFFDTGPLNKSELIVRAELVPGKHRSYLSLHSSVGVVGVHDHTQFLEVCWRSEFRFMG